jgi:hypothetical protein
LVESFAAAVQTVWLVWLQTAVFWLHRADGGMYGSAFARMSRQALLRPALPYRMKR